MDNRPGNVLKEKIHHLEMDYHLVPLSLPAVNKIKKESNNRIKKKTLIMKHVIIDWTGTTISWRTKENN
jgi:hypothetical protein